MNYAITGPGAATNNSMRAKAKKLVSQTVLNSYFNNVWGTRNRSQNYAIWDEKGKMMGFALVKKHGKTLIVSLIGTKPGRGIGTHLLRRIIEDAHYRKISKINLNSVSNAIPFYSKFGFKINRVDANHTFMRLKLMS